MKKYLLINHYSLQDDARRAYTHTKVIEADTPDQAMAKDAYDVFTAGDSDKWNYAVKTKRLIQSTVGVYELVTGKNEIEDEMEADK